ncbi:MAG: glucosaminidase domain-containing protein [Campylobacteraceae bacterium]|jgi:Bax protein|nr:glucosaminidase domain-containing protein [Campylobacteraceae bacterium]
MRFLISLLLCAVFASSVGANTFDEDFFKIKNSALKKQEFIERMIPLVKQTNENVLAERKIVEDFFKEFKKNKSLEDIDESVMEQMRILAKKYYIKSITDERVFKNKVAPVPLSLAITQAAIETGWGSSRFFKEAKNAFGEWTYSKTSGLIPDNREEGKTHRIKAFKTVQASVDSYVLNLNRHNAYSDFRNLRVILGEEFNGIVATSKMANYSQMREDYIKLLRHVMISNKLTKYDTIDDAPKIEIASAEVLTNVISSN